MSLIKSPASETCSFYWETTEMIDGLSSPYNGDVEQKSVNRTETSQNLSVFHERHTFFDIRLKWRPADTPQPNQDNDIFQHMSFVFNT